MNPSPASKHLEMFKDAYRRFHEYLLVPGIVKPDRSNLRFCRDLGILKHEIRLRRVEDIGINDEDSVVLDAGDVPHSPTERGRKVK